MRVRSVQYGHYRLQGLHLTLWDNARDTMIVPTHERCSGDTPQRQHEGQRGEEIGGAAIGGASEADGGTGGSSFREEIPAPSTIV